METEKEHPKRFLLSDSVRDLQSVGGNELGELLQTVNETDLLAELVAVDSRWRCSGEM